MALSAIEKLARRAIAAYCEAPEAVVRLLTRRPISVDGRVLDPRIQHVTALHRSPLPVGLHTRPVPEARQMFRLLMAGLEPLAGPNVAPEVAQVDDTSWPSAIGPQELRIYRTRPRERAVASPALIYLHGGGFVVGGPDTCDALCRRIATEAGCVVLNFEYRLAPEHPFPGPAQDAIAILDYVFDNVEALGIDPARVTIGGDSAGGCLSAIACAHRTRNKPTAPQPVAQCLIYPLGRVDSDFPSRSSCDEGFVLDGAVLDWFASQHAADPDSPLASPLMAPDLRGVPPAFVLTAGFDPLRDEGHAYAEHLASFGVDVLYREYRATVHGFINMGFSEITRDAIGDMSRVLNAAFEGRELEEALPGTRLSVRQRIEEAVIHA